MGKEGVVYTHTHGILAIKKNKILPFATTCMDLESIMLSEKSDRERKTLYAFTYKWNP